MKIWKFLQVFDCHLESCAQPNNIEKMNLKELFLN